MTKAQKEALKLADAIIAYHEFVPKVDPNCRQCGGTGEYEWESPHNGDFRTSSCECRYSKRVEPKLPVYSKELLMMARIFKKSLKP